MFEFEEIEVMKQDMLMTQMMVNLRVSIWSPSVWNQLFTITVMAYYHNY